MINKKSFSMTIVLLLFLCLYSQATIDFGELEYKIVEDENLSIAVGISNLATPLRAYQISINYDTNYFNCSESDFTEGSLLQSCGQETEFYVDGSDGNFTIAGSILGVTDGCTESGTLFEFELTNKNEQTLDGTPLEFTDVVLRGVLNENITSAISNTLIKIDSTPVFLNLKVILEGAWDPDTNMMRHDLIDNNLIPKKSPYDGEEIDEFPDVSPHYIVDWVYVGLNDTPQYDPSQGCNAFILEDGSLIRTDGSCCFPLYFTENTDYYILIKHRNHMQLLSNRKIFLSNDSQTPTELNLCSPHNILNAIHNTCNLGDVCAMLAGDADNNKKIFPDDRNSYWLPYAGTQGYYNGDFNLDGYVFPDDANDNWKTNAGKSFIYQPNKEDK